LGQGEEKQVCLGKLDKEALPQIDLAMLFGQNSHLPAYYRRMPGNITDVATLKTTMQSLDFLGAVGMHFILDRGFYREQNIDELFLRHHPDIVTSAREFRLLVRKGGDNKTKTDF
jgi:transposase